MKDDAVQKGRTLHEEDLQQLLSRGLIEDNNGLYTISLDIARKTNQVSEYTKLKGLERDKLKLMTQQFVKNAGEDGIKLDAIFRFLKDALPTGKTDEQNKRLVRRILKKMQANGMIKSKGRTWYEQIIAITIANSRMFGYNWIILAIIHLSYGHKTEIIADHVEIRRFLRRSQHQY